MEYFFFELKLSNFLVYLKKYESYSFFIHENKTNLLEIKASVLFSSSKKNNHPQIKNESGQYARKVLLSQWMYHTKTNHALHKKLRTYFFSLFDDILFYFTFMFVSISFYFVSDCKHFCSQRGLNQKLPGQMAVMLPVLSTPDPLKFFILKMK